MNGPVAVTGATGRIGAPLLRALLEAGHEVRALSRRAQPPRDGVTWVTGDILDATIVARLVEGCATVFHAAGELSGPSDAMRRSLADGTAIVLGAARHLRVVHLSSLVVLDTATVTDRPIDERSPLEPTAVRRGAYTQAKADAEARARSVAMTQDVVIVRPGLVVDDATSLLPIAVGLGVGPLVLLVGSRDATLPVVHADDVAAGLLIAASAMQSGEILHLVDPLPVGRAMMARRMLPRGEAGVIGAGEFMLAAARRLNRFASGRLADASYRVLSAGTAHQWSAERAIRLGWQPTKLAAWCAATNR